jgi:selenophosphate synthase
VTDVTGFGLLQAVQPRLKSHTQATIHRSQVPTLERVASFVGEHGLVTQLGEANMMAVRESPAFELDSIDMATLLILSDPQTSGGLVAAVRESTSLPDGWSTIGRINASSENGEPRVVVL